jgi:hypothetical protein
MELPPEVITEEIFKYLKDRDKIMFALTCKHYYHILRKTLTLNEKRLYDKIKNSSFFDCFTNLKYPPITADTRFPKRLRCIDIKSKLSSLEYVNSKDSIRKIKIYENIEFDCETSIFSKFTNLKKLVMGRTRVTRTIFVPEGVTDLKLYYLNGLNEYFKIEGFACAMKETFVYIPKTIKTMNIQGLIGIRIAEYHWWNPSAIKCLTYIQNEDPPVFVGRSKDFLPPSIESLNIKGYLSTIASLNNLRVLIFSYDLPHLGPLPERLEVLDLSTCFNFNEDLPPLPNTLRELYLNSSFNRDLKLPPSIEVLDLGKIFNKSVNFENIPKLRALKLSLAFNQPISVNALPELRELSVGICYREKINFPKLRVLEMTISSNTTISNLPDTLERLKIEDVLYAHKPCDIDINIDKLPNLRYLYLDCKLNKVIDVPKSVVVLVIRGEERSKIRTQGKVEIREISELGSVSREYTISD